MTGDMECVGIVFQAYQGPRQTRVFHDIPNRADVKLEEGLEAKFAVINIKSKQYKVTKVGTECSWT